MTTNELNRQFSRILASENTDFEKIRLLVTIGISEPIAAQIVENRANTRARVLQAARAAAAAQMAETNTENNAPTLAEVFLQNFENYTFGIELECFAARQRLIESGHESGAQIMSDSYNHNDRHDGVFKLVTDASVEGLPNAVECVSSVLPANADGFGLVRNVCNALAGAGARINKTCGFHVHIGAEQMTDFQYISVFVNYMYLQPIIDKFMPLSRVDSQWARNMSRHAAALESCTTKAAVYPALNFSRYWAVNPHAYSRHKTVEFRQHNGTVEYEKIYNWLMFLLQLCEFSKENRYTRETRPLSLENLTWLAAEQKTYYKQRTEHFENARVAAA